jgi:predicted Fe-Mo cluster-binding NifX family protein
MIEPISDCQIVIARGMGTGAHRSLLAGKIHPIVTDVENIEEALNAYLSGSLTDHPEKLH